MFMNGAEINEGIRRILNKPNLHATFDITHRHPETRIIIQMPLISSMHHLKRAGKHPIKFINESGELAAHLYPDKHYGNNRHNPGL